jgi:membrane protein
MSLTLAAVRRRFETLLADLSHFPWRTTAHTLRERFREDQLSLTASSLTFTTSLALVPFFTVALAVFTIFPMFGKMQDVLQRWLVQSLIPDTIARQVLGYLTQFASQASKLGSVGLAIVLVTALALILTIDRTLNRIWRVRRPRPLGQRVLIYWAAITLGPLILGASLVLTSYAISSSQGVVDSLPGGVRVLLDVIEFALLSGGMAALYHYVPNTRVRWAHAWAGGAFVAAGIELSKRLLSLYMASVPTYSMVYGAFATLPILLVWIYVAWVIVLLGAVIAAYLPSLLTGVARRAGGHGWQFQLAVEVVQALRQVRAPAAPLSTPLSTPLATPPAAPLAYAGLREGHGLSATQLAQALRVGVLQLETVLDTLGGLDWIGKLDEMEGPGLTRPEPRYVLLADPERTPLAPLVEQLLLQDGPGLESLWKNSGLRALFLRDVL